MCNQESDARYGEEQKARQYRGEAAGIGQSVDPNYVLPEKRYSIVRISGDLGDTVQHHYGPFTPEEFIEISHRRKYVINKPGVQEFVLVDHGRDRLIRD